MYSLWLLKPALISTKLLVKTSGWLLGATAWPLRGKQLNMRILCCFSYIFVFFFFGGVPLVLRRFIVPHLTSQSLLLATVLPKLEMLHYFFLVSDMLSFLAGSSWRAQE